VISRYMRQSQKGRQIKVEHPDVSRAFQVYNRSEVFDIGLDEVSAHTLALIDIIKEEEAKLQAKQQKEIERKKKTMNNTGRL